ncbi:MAG: M28 family peptidase [Candidatus Hodarchaeales archaeon]
MKIGNELLEHIEIENIYKHILNLHYERSPVFSKDKLEKARKYIETEFEKYGLQPKTFDFQLDGSSEVFSNIQADLNSNKPAEILITSHYDHLRGSPGADDNLSAVAIMLEIARVMKENDIKTPIRFISFTLEEQNPIISGKIFQKGLELGLYDENKIPKTLHFHKLMKSYIAEYYKAFSNGEPLQERLFSAFNAIQDLLSEAEKEFFQYRISLLLDSKSTNWTGFFGIVGSTKYVQHILNSEHKIRGVLNLETCGFTSDLPHSQRFLSPDLLRSDHTPFWKEMIPALMLTDTGNFRNPYYHTPGDTINTLDFDFIHKVAKSTLLTSLNY